LILYTIKTSDFEVFLKNSQNTFIKKLLVSNIIQKNSNDIEILPYIKKIYYEEEKGSAFSY
jgi:hypothetical protein